MDNSTTKDKPTTDAGPEQKHGAKRACNNYIPQVDTTQLQAMIQKRVGEMTWLRSTGGAILRRVRYILKEPQHGNEDCVHKLVKGHHAATAAWLWQATRVTRELLTGWSVSGSEAYPQRVYDYLTQWNEEVMQAPGVTEYLMQHTGVSCTP